MNRFMRKKLPLILMIFLLIDCHQGFGLIIPKSIHTGLIDNDTIEKQILFNGRVWRNLYNRIEGDQFLFTKEFRTGTVTINGKLYNNLKLKYDIFNDELLTITDHGHVIQLNKEKVDKFNINFESGNYQFQRIDPDSVNSLSGYVNVLYSGKTSLFIKYKKEILFLAVDNKYDMFNQLHKIYIKKENQIFPVNNNRDFYSLLKDYKKQVRSFMKSNKLRISKKVPESFKPVVEYYDKLRH